MNKKLIRSIILTLSILFSLFYSQHVLAKDAGVNVTHVEKSSLTAEQQSKIEKVDKMLAEECANYTVVYEKENNMMAKLPNTGVGENVGYIFVGVVLLAFATVLVKNKKTKVLIAVLASGAVLSLPLSHVVASEKVVLKEQRVAVGDVVQPLELKGYKFVGIIKEKYPCELVPQKPNEVTPPTPKKVETKIPNDAPKAEKEVLKTTRHLIEGTMKELTNPELGFVGEKTGVIEKEGIKYQYANKTEETSDVRTHWYKEVETKIPSDAPKAEKEALKTTRHLIEGTMKELTNPELGFVGEKTGVIEKEGIKYQYANKTEETSDVRTHWYKEVETKIPSDAPKAEKEVLKTTRHLIEGTMKELAEPEMDFTNAKEGIIEKDGEKYQYTNKTDETSELRTHWYKALPKKNKDAKVNVFVEIYYKDYTGIVAPAYPEQLMGSYPVYKKIGNNDELVNNDYNFTIDEIREWGKENIKGNAASGYGFSYKTFDSILRDKKIKENSDPFNGTFKEGKDIHLKLVYEGPLFSPQ